MHCMQRITHRQLRNDSAEILRRVATGETILVTNHGEPAAVIGPPSGHALAALSAHGQVRPARTSPATLRSIKRRKAARTAAEIAANTRGPW
jgi:prevent-host-death family protein